MVIVVSYIQSGIGIEFYRNTRLNGQHRRICAIGMAYRYVAGDDVGAAGQGPGGIGQNCSADVGFCI